MQIKFIGYNIQGFGRLSSYAIRWTRMVQEKAKRKGKILSFWSKYGLKATIEAFGVRERTLYLWKAKLKKGGGRLEALNEKSRKPKVVRRRLWQDEIKLNIRSLRKDHPNLGSDKIHGFLKVFCQQNKFKCPCPRTIARIISDAPDKMRIFPVKVRHNGQIVKKKRTKKDRKPKHFKALYPGHCGSFDTIERFVNGCRRYIITFTDLFSRFSFAWATNSHASLAASEVFKLISLVFPYKLNYVLTDNGSEFMKHFDLEIKKQYSIHWHTYPKCPKMNAYTERFNRTIQEEFVDYHDNELINPNLFNQKLISYLLWYNGERPHYGLNLKSPIQYLTLNNPEDCNMWWRNTMPESGQDMWHGSLVK